VIYEFPPQTDPIRQGDIFVGLPRLDMSLKHIPVISEAGEQIEIHGTISLKPDSPLPLWWPYVR